MRNKTKITLPAQILFDQQLTESDLRVMTVLCYHWTRTKRLSDPSRQDIASLARICEARASTCLSRLVKQGWVSRIRRADDARKFGYRIHWNHMPKPAKVGCARETEITKVGCARETEITKVGCARETDHPVGKVGCASATEITEKWSKIDQKPAFSELTPYIKNNTTLILSYISIKSAALGGQVQCLKDRQTELAQLPVDSPISSAKEAVDILTIFGVPPNYLVVPSRRNIYQAWMNRGTTFRQLIDACVTARRRRIEDQDIRPIGVAYVDRILTNKPNHEDYASMVSRAEDAFLSG